MLVGRTARPDLPGRAVSSVGLVAALAAFLVSAGAAAAQPVPLVGRVIDAGTGVPVPGASVKAIQNFVVVATGATDAQGAFRMQGADGPHALVVTAPGYQPLRLDGIVASGDALPDALRLSPIADLHDPPVTAPDRARRERVRSGTTAASVVGRDQVRAWGARALADPLETVPGVTVAWTGVRDRRVVLRGFNRLFAGGPLLLEDERPVGGPSTGFGAWSFLSSSLADVDRMEVLRGPQSVLYGPDAAAGVVRVVTASPIDAPGAFASLSAGQRELYHGAVRQSVRLGPRSGLRLSGHYFRARNGEGAPTHLDSVGPSPSPPSPITETWGGQIRYDLRPWDDGEVVLAAGMTRVLNSVLLLRDGPVEVTDWTQSFARARVTRGRLWAQGFANRGDAGSSVAIGGGRVVVDGPALLGAQVLYGRRVHPLLDLTAGLDASHLDPDTRGTLHGLRENADGVSRVGGYLYGISNPSERSEVAAGLRLDYQTPFQGARFSPRLALRFDLSDRHTLRASVNRGYDYPTPDLLFADRVTDRIPLLDTLGFDVRIMGLPDQGLTFDRRCPGGLEERCMFSPLLPGIRMPATGAAVWDAVLVPLVLESETLRSTLAGMGITPNAFAQIIGRPGPADLTSRMVRWTPEGGGGLTGSAAAPAPVARLRPATTQSLEMGLQGSPAAGVWYSLDVHATRVSDLVGPLQVATPTLYLDGTSVDAFLLRRMIAVGIPAGVADQIAAGISETAADVPLGTLAPDQRDDPDVLLAYRNLGSVDFWGADLGLHWQLLEGIRVSGSLAFLSADCFDVDGDGVCGTEGDVTLNAPTLGGSAAVRWQDPVRGVTLEGRARHANAFPVNGGGYRGRVAPHTALDVHGRVILPWAPGAAVSVTVRNLMGSAHDEFVGAPTMGRMAFMTLQYAF